MIADEYENNDFGFTFSTHEDIGVSTDQAAEYRKKIKNLEDQLDQLNSNHQNDLQYLESLILPLLKNLLKEPEKEYIIWKDREEPIQAQIKKIMAVTRRKQ